MNKLDVIKNVLDKEVLDYLESLDCFESHFSDETSFNFESDGVEYEATVSIDATFKLTGEYLTDDYCNRCNLGTSKELNNYRFEIIDLIDLENGSYLIQDRKVSEGLN